MRRTLERARARLFLTALVRCSGWALAGAALVGAGLVAATRLGVLPLPADGWWLGLPTVAAAVGAALLVAVGVAAAALRLTLGLAGAARAVERHFGLSERLSTSLELGERRDAVAEALRADADAHASALTLRGFAPPRLSRRQGAALLAGSALLAIALLAPLPSGAPGVDAVIGGEPAAGVAADHGADLARVRIDDLLMTVAGEAGASAREARSDESAGPRDGGTAGNTGVTGAERQTGVASLPATAAPANAVERQRDDVSDALRAVAEAAGRQQAPPVGTEPAAPSLRNDGSTNPTYGAASTRDQELRDYARRRESAAAPGGGGGEPVALADAAVAGDATAGYEGGGGEGLPGAPQRTSELDIPDVTDPSGRRVRVERLPDAPDLAGLDRTAAWVEFVAADEPRVSRPPSYPDDLDLLRRYRSLAGAVGQ
ncbi:MAG: hypothetical protein KF875_15005 [Trueperaceae bacterium]|nr:hypothetical protein [Trueperaceae bacterium]MCO5173059.1 hypothetical protein [Trueperaceae bacterium]